MPPSQVKISSVIPVKLIRKIRRKMEDYLPVKLVDRLDRFWVQTRLLFSKSMLAMVAGLLAFFIWVTIEMEVFRFSDILEFLFLQATALTILLHMGLWTREKEYGTYELFIMRLKRPSRVIWSKLTVSFIWTILLIMPFFIGLTWFVTMNFKAVLLCLLFLIPTAMLTAIFTCIVSTFVRSSLPAAIISGIILAIIAGILAKGQLPWSRYYNPFLNPLQEYFIENIPYRKQMVFIVVNRLSIITGIGLLYWWLYNRMKVSERWSK